ncbi:MAG TPA: right-handed parallel beta-helix repeat-containing protein [Candidatus Acidoferrales bacterium]|jgi:parallel beta-helix repeat protein|nr:right-handed parallel beta-helix repeat-containing protein [Candidatus Acidoferrales bacterium]
MSIGKMKALCALLIVAPVMLVCTLAPSAQASTVVVGTCKTGLTSFMTIQAAVNAVPAGSTIDVCPATYPEQVTINKKLTILGVESGTSDAAIVVPPNGGLIQNGTDIFGNPVAAQIFVVGASGVVISHITVDGSGNGLSSCTIDPIGIYFQNSSGTITDDVARNQILGVADQGCQVGLAINVESNSGAPMVTISSNSVRNYQKNGITASGPDTNSGGPDVTVSGNTVIGIGATANIAQNGIQIGYGAQGKVTGNYVADDIYTGPLYGSSGILIYASSGITVTANTVESTQLAIVPASDTMDPASGQIITGNHIGGTQTFDAIDLCSNGNTAESNVIYGSAQSGIHLDDSCGSSNSNTVKNNTINEACAGILLGTGSNPNITPNTFFNVVNTTLAGDSCTAAPTLPNKAGGTTEKHQSLRASPYKR